MSDLREILAAEQHAIWSHWMRYQFSVCVAYYPSGGLLIPLDKLERWMRQISTDYADLTEKEKASDREQADKIIAALDKAHVEATEHTCTWTVDYDSVDGPIKWDTTCGRGFNYFDEGLAEHFYHYCPNCGGKIVEANDPPKEWDEDDEANADELQQRLAAAEELMRGLAEPWPQTGKESDGRETEETA